MILVLSKCGKISNAQVAVSAITAVLKRLSQLSGKTVTAIMKKLSQLLGKVVTAIRKSCDIYHETVVTVVIRQLFALGRSKKVKLVISDCWRGHSALWIWLKNGKISLKGILLFWV